MNKIAVYLAGAYTGDVGRNMNRHIDTANALIDMGYLPLVPCLFHFLEMYKPRDYETYMDLDLALMHRANCLYRMEGESPGADREVKYALNELQIPIYTNFNDLMKGEPVEQQRKNCGFVFGGGE